MSLNKLRHGYYIKFIVKGKRKLIDKEVLIDDLKYIASKSEFIKDILLDENATTKEYHLDVSESTFDFVIENLKYSKITLTNNLDIDEIRKFALYLRVDDKAFKQLTVNTQDIFKLTDIDSMIHEYDNKVRNFVFENEESDLRDKDSTLIFEKVCIALDYKINKNNDNKTYYYRSAFDTDKPCLRCKQDGDLSYTRIPGKVVCKHHNYGKISKSVDPDYIISKRGSYYTIGVPKQFDVNHIGYNFENYKTIFDKLTNGYFKDLDFTDIVVAGGAALNALTYATPYPDEHNDPYLESDIDFFIITKDPHKANKAVENLLYHIRRLNLQRDPYYDTTEMSYIHRNMYCITTYIVSKYTSKNKPIYKKVQIILRLYNSVSQVISGFDVDACCIAYDGKDVYTMPRFVRCLSTGYNIADPERQSKNYHSRLYKYISRGFAIALPGYDSKRVVKSVNVDGKLTGLARLVQRHLQHPNKRDNESDYEYQENSSNPMNCAFKILMKEVNRSSFDFNLKPFTNNNGSINHVEVIPHLCKLLMEASYYIPYFSISKNIGFILGYNYDEKETLVQCSYVEGELKYKTKNSGTQHTNSFHPTQENWYYDLYVYDENNISHHRFIDDS